MVLIPKELPANAAHTVVCVCLQRQKRGYLGNSAAAANGC